VVAVAAVALVLVSGGSGADPRTPAALPGLPAPFLGTAVAGSGGITAAIDAYGDVVDLRSEPAGPALIDNSSARQAAGTVAADTGIVPRVSVDAGPALPFWHADSVTQSYLPETNVVRTVARFGPVRAIVTDAAHRSFFARVIQVRAPDGAQVGIGLGVNVEHGMTCRRGQSGGTMALFCAPGSPSPAGGGGARAAGPRVVNQARSLIAQATRADRQWLRNGTALGPSAPSWARQMDARSQLTLRALTGRQTGAVAAGARDGWAYVWPRDAATAVLAFEVAGRQGLAKRATRFLLGLNPEEAARFRGDGRSVPGRGPQGDAAGWIAAAAHAAGLASPTYAYQWRNRPDYQEGSAGDYLSNAIAAAALTTDVSELSGSYEHQTSDTSAVARQIARLFGTEAGLVRRAGDPGSGLDSAAAWAVRPFALPALFPAVRRTLLHLAANQTRFGIVPGEGWSGGGDPWMAPTAWTAWALAALAGSAPTPAAGRVDRRQALRLLDDLRRSATPAGALPERVNAESGVPSSTTPLAWPHAFAILALRELWPSPQYVSEFSGSYEHQTSDTPAAKKIKGDASG
jgi:hypothetical protein